MKIQRSIEIAAVPEKIWPFLVKPANIMRWCGNVQRIHRTSEQDSGLGGRFYFEEKAMGRLMKLHFVVTEWEVNRSVAYKMTSGNFVKGYEQKYTLEPNLTGIKLTCFEEVILPFGFMGKFAGIIRRPVSVAHVNRMLVNLKTLGES